jgi:hypothetical protein
MNPWNQKDTIENAIARLEQAGFVADTSPYYADKICIFSSNHGFRSDAVLETFDTWEEVIAFARGWSKHDLSTKIMKAKNKKASRGKS